MSLLGKDLEQLKTGSQFVFSATKIDKLGASEYTLATIVCDTSGSVAPFSTHLENMVKTVMKSCQKSPRSDNLMLRFVTFANDLSEVHGFKLLNSCQEDDYNGSINCGGSTALFGATLEAVEATAVYGERLTKQEFLVNGIVFVVTDGEENASSGITAEAIQKAVADAGLAEKLESLSIVLVGVTNGQTGLTSYLKDFSTRAGITQYVDIGNATPGRIAKLAQFVSQSVSSTSSALGTGKASTPITPGAFTI